MCWFYFWFLSALLLFDLQNLPIGGKGFYDLHGWLESLPAVGKTRLQVGLGESFREFH